MAGPFFVDSTYGSDANNGTSSSTPKATLTAAVALFDASSTETLYINGTFRPDATVNTNVVALTTKTGKTICQMPALDPTGGTLGDGAWLLPVGSSIRNAVIRGDRLVTGTWTHIGDNVYTNDTAIPTGLTISAITYGWDTHAVSAIGQHAWAMVLVASAAAVTTYATGTGGAKGVCHYATGTGIITAYFGGDNPNTSGHAVGYCTSEATLAAIRMVTCTDCTVSNIAFALFPVYSTQFGWGVRMEGSTGCAVMGCTFDDMGLHAIGTIGGSGNSSNNTFSGCVIRGLPPTGTPVVFNGLNAEGAITNAVVGGTIHLTRWLGIDGAYAHGQLGAVAALAANTQTGVYAHADSGNVVVSLIRVSGTTISNTEGVGNTKAVEGDNAVAVAVGSRKTFSAYPMQVTGCTITGFKEQSICVNTAHVAYRQTVFSTTAAAATGFGAAGVLFRCDTSDSNNYLRLYENCTFVADLSGSSTRMFSGQASGGGTKRFSFINCSFYNTTATKDYQAWFDPATEAVVYFECVGCSFAHPNVAGSNAFLFIHFDSVASVAAGTFLDNIYYNHGQYGFVNNPTAANWVAGTDTSATVAANVLAAIQYASVSSLSLTTTAQLLRRATSTTIPSSAGINGVRYSGNFGAWQYIPPGDSNGSVPRVRRCKRVNRVNR